MTFRWLLWNSLLDADMSSRYWDHLIRRRVQLEHRINLGLAVATSGTAAALLVQSGPLWVWKALSSASAFIAIWLSVSTRMKPVERMSRLRRCWLDCMHEYERLWVRLDAGENETEIRSQFEKVQCTQTDGTEDEAHFSRDEQLLRKCQADVRKARGLKKKGREGNDAK